MNGVKRNFTLIELLTVVVIISMIVGVTIPTFNRIMNGTAVSYATRQVTSELNMARTEAAARRKYVAVIFLDDAIKVHKDQLELASRRYYRSCYVTLADGGSEYNFDRWIPGTKWESLPVGAYFSELPTASKQIKTIKDDITSADGNVPILAGDTDTSSCVIFNTLGRPDATSLISVKIAEGVVSQNKTESDAFDVTNTNTDNWQKCSVKHLTGQVFTHGPEE